MKKHKVKDGKGKSLKSKEAKAAQDDDERAHVYRCKLRSCLRCKWIRCRKSWQKQCPVLPDVDAPKNLPPEKQLIVNSSWLQAKLLGNEDTTKHIIMK